MARITVEDCLKVVGSENRFALIHLALARLKQHRKGHPYLIESKNKEVVTTLREIAAGLVTAENIKEFDEAFEAEIRAAEEARAAAEAEARAAEEKEAAQAEEQAPAAEAAETAAAAGEEQQPE